MDDYGILYKKIEAQDKIINTQALEIARLKEDKKKAIEYMQENKVYAELEDYMKNGDYYIKVDELLEILGDKENE